VGAGKEISVNHIIKEAVIDWDALEAEARQALEYTEHDWGRNEGGDIATDWLSKDRQHFGPRCRCCGYEPCLRCVGRADTCVAIETTCGC
jgi:hypothetical protein